MVLHGFLHNIKKQNKMIKIKSISAGFPAQEATTIEISVITFKTDAVNVMTYWQLYNDSAVVLSSGNYELTENQYKSWGADNKFVENCVISFLGIERF